MHDDDLDDGYNVIISAKKNMYGNIFTLLTIVIQYMYREIHAYIEQKKKKKKGS